MNCSESRRLHRLLIRLWKELRPGDANSSSTSPMLPTPPLGTPEAQGKAAAGGGGAGEDDAYLYILLIMIFYGCLAGGLILAYTRSRKLESKHDPYHLYIERDWRGGSGAAGEEGGGRRERRGEEEGGRREGERGGGGEEGRREGGERRGGEVGERREPCY
ncbi:potassium voltage-gated channel subfamily E regulatory beta subunit 5 [Sceloporus undulatus]|uniref:potassium voltage-gated channel subfamily E regulatory beta subunit 5 n=1 Tax=Sceloporus undulatus TaxID=8520 RepID=UPI001C4D45DA|nr:potassium voltage-gated channel subfamily E regulatory beta subunit 5 [Sceloporus undulatus]